jgi:hypothetical protein
VCMVWNDLNEDQRFMSLKFIGEKCYVYFKYCWMHDFNWHEAYDKFSNEEMSF